MGQIVTTVAALTGGISAVVGGGAQWRLEVAGLWALNETVTLLMTDRLTAASERAGFGPSGGQRPVYLKTYDRKLNFVAGQNWFFSALDMPTVFDKLDTPGNSFVELANQYGFADDLLAIGILRNRLVFFGRQHIQIWNVDPDPAQNRRFTTLESTGTVNGASVRGIGRGDLLFCTDAGVRSLAKRVASEDAEVEDVGTPIDSIIQAALDANGTSAICSIVEPRTSRYWLAIGSTIYVLSFFPSAQVVAWSTYQASVEMVKRDGADYQLVGGGNEYEAWFDDLTVGRTYVFRRGITERNLGTATLEEGATFLPDVDGSFVATGTTAHLKVTSPTPPGEVTASLHEVFTPEKFVVLNGLIYVRSTTGQLYRYGGSNNATYDGACCSWETPWLDAKSPGTEKPTRGLDTAMEGQWAVKVGTATESNNPLKQVLQHTGSTFRLGSIPVQMQGTHFKARAESIGSAYARFGMFVYHFAQGNQR